MKTLWFYYSPDPDDTGSSTSTETADTDINTDDTGEDTSGTSVDDSGANDAATDNSNDATDNSSSEDENNDDSSASSGGTSSIDTTTGPFLFVDVYSGDLKGAPDWNVLAGTPDFYGAILKATQGKKGYSNDKGWFNKNWPLLKDAGGDRYGSTWFRGAYLFLNLWDDGEAQAENYLEKIDAAGGWGNGDMYPIVDVELGNDGSNGGKRNPNQNASTQQIIDCTTSCANKLRSETGRSVILYGRGAMRDRSITDKMGCDAVWNPAYTQTMPLHGLEAWTLDDIVLWQYCGDGKSAVTNPKLVNSIANFGKPDISVYVEGKNKPSFEVLKQKLGIGL